MGVLNLLDSYIISKFNDNIEIPHVNNSLDENYFLNLEKSVEIDHVNNYINSKIKNQRKYGGFDTDQNYLLNFNHARLINRDFNILYINRSNINDILSKQNKRSASISISNQQFKPNIGVKSKLLSQEYKKKMVNENAELFGNNSEQMNYVDILMHKKQQSINKNNKLLEEKEKKELSLCTFAPKINKSIQLKDYKVENRIEFLYKEGVKKKSNRTMISQDEIDLKKNVKEYTFKPEIYHEEVKREKSGKKILCQENSSENIKLYERLKKGREVHKLI